MSLRPLTQRDGIASPYSKPVPWVLWCRSFDPLTGWHPLDLTFVDEAPARAEALLRLAQSQEQGTSLNYAVAPRGARP